RMLPVRARFTPVDRSGLAGDSVAVEGDVLAVALHRQLLEICRKSLQVLLIWQDCDRLGAKEIVVPNGEQTQDHWQVGFKGSGAKMLIHLVKAVQHSAEVVGTDRDHSRKSDRRIH